MTILIRCNGCAREFEPLSIRTLDNMAPPGWVKTTEKDMVASDAIGEECFEVKHYCHKCLKKLKRMKDD